MYDISPHRHLHDSVNLQMTIFRGARLLKQIHTCISPHTRLLQSTWKLPTLSLKRYVICLLLQKDNVVLLVIADTK